MVSQRITKDQLLGLITLREDEISAGLTVEKKANDIWETSKYIVSYTHFKTAIDLGLNVGLNDIPFERAMIFSWIKEGIESGRKT